jgi:energy-coupling factor transporter ATP-binding protein EcfA2
VGYRDGRDLEEVIRTADFQDEIEWVWRLPTQHEEQKTLESDVSSSPADSDAIVALYRQRANDFGGEKDRLARRANRISHARVATFLVAGVCFLAGVLAEFGNAGWLAAGIVVLAVFLSLVWWYGRVLAESERFGQLGEINRQAAARVRRVWDGLPVTSAGKPADEEALAGDLDLFGEASLFHLVSMANTPIGVAMLSDWFLHPGDPGTVVERQQAVAELAPALEMRQELRRRGLKVADRRTDPGRFFHWAEAEPWLAKRHWLKWASWCLPVLLVLCAVLGAMGVVPSSAWVVPFAMNVALGSMFCRQVHEIFGSISSRHGEIGHYADLFQLIGAVPVASAYMTQLQQQTAARDGEAGHEIQRLGRIMDLANLRFSSMAYFLIQSVTCWDFHILALLEGWQRRNGSRVRRWFEALGEWEAVCSLANLAYDNPQWVFPVIENQPLDEQSLRARSLGHPLIPDDRRVANDVTIGPRGTFLMVTGSNMSGKSTLLRSVGANVVLAQAGGPVCADEFTLPPVLLATSMRIHDSLTSGVSFYMAELKRLKQIVDAARERRAGSGRAFLYLLDEILQGTNTSERQIAVRRVLAHLIAEGAIGAVSTHDLQLAADPVLAKAGRAVHFRETIHSESGRQEMTFDYKLREGLATTSNALKLLEMVGLGEG